MSSMLEDLLERAEEQTRLGDRTKATALLRAAVAGATADLERKPTERTRAVRAVAAYQLATLLLQDATTAKEGDALVWRLGFGLRLADEALRWRTGTQRAGGTSRTTLRRRRRRRAGRQPRGGGADLRGRRAVLGRGGIDCYCARTSRRRRPWAGRLRASPIYACRVFHNSILPAKQSRLVGTLPDNVCFA